MNAQVTKLQAAENDLKELMADMTRAIKKAEEAIGKIAPSDVAGHSRDGIHGFVAVVGGDGMTSSSVTGSATGTSGMRMVQPQPPTKSLMTSCRGPHRSGCREQ